MLQLEKEESIPKKELIYWIDKEFVQSRALSLFGREFSDEEINQTTKLIESGLAYSVFEIIDIDLKETKYNNHK